VSSLFASLTTASNALDVIGQAIGVVQNNVSNASTPGYVNQSLDLTASAFDASGNLWGGVHARGVDSSRNVFAEQAVWNANEQAGQSSQQASSLDALQQFFSVSGTSGVPAALSGVYSAFSAFSANPTDATSRQQVISAANTFAQTINETATNVEQLRSQTDTQISGAVAQINNLTAQIAVANADIQQGGSKDAGVQTQLYNSIEKLSNLVPVSVLTASDGTATVLLGGQSPLVTGSTSHPLSVTAASEQAATIPNATPDTAIQTDQGVDVTSLSNQGQLGGLLSFRNTTIPSVIGDDQQQGSLNQLANTFADRVNTLLTNGQVSAGPPAVAGQPLFTYTAGTPTEVASSLAVSPAITASTLAAIAPGPPAVANGTATQLANLSTSQDSADQINNLSYTAFYSSVAAGIGQSQSNAASNQQTQAQLLTQAQTMRAQVSGVSLNDQASLLMQYQQSYQAAAQVISVINSVTQSLLSTMQQIQ